MTAPVPGRTNTSVASGEARRAAIIAAATTLFAAQGHHATSLSQIGRQAGVGKTAILHHFASKDAIVNAVLDEHERRIMPVLLSIGEDRGLTAIRRMVEIVEHNSRHREHTALWSMVVAEAATPGATLSDRVNATYRGYRKAVMGLLAQAQEDGEMRHGVDHRRVAIGMLAFINGMTSSWLIDPEVPLVDIVGAHLDELVAGLRK